jgi:hypothetical protein
MKQSILTFANNDSLIENNVQSRHSLQSWLIFWVLALYLSIPNFEAPLRYFLSELDIPWVIYFRDILVVLLGMWFILKTIISYDHDNIIIYIVCILLFHSLIGLIYLPDFYMILFGWKIFLPILIGLGSYYVFVEKLNKIKCVFLGLYVIAISGMFINYFIEFPWEGFTYTLDMYKIEATRIEEVAAFGIKRLAGFHRFAFDAAIQIILLSVFLVVHIKSNLYKIIIWAVAGLAILLTTSKGILLSYLLISILLGLHATDKKIISYYSLYRKMFLIFIILAILLPFLFKFNLSYGILTLPDEINDMLFTSFTMRLYDIWPEVIEIIQDYGNPVLGRGLGGIGQSQIFFENYLFNSADNIFLYLYAQFGLLGFFYLFYLYYKSRSLNSERELYFCLLVFIIFQYGVTTNIFESSSLCLSVGFVLAHLNNYKLRTEYQRQLNTDE